MGKPSRALVITRADSRSLGTGSTVLLFLLLLLLLLPFLLALGTQGLIHPEGTHKQVLVATPFV